MAWSDAARAAAIEARRMRAKAGAPAKTAAMTNAQHAARDKALLTSRGLARVGPTVTVPRALLARAIKLERLKNPPNSSAPIRQFNQRARDNAIGLLRSDALRGALRGPGVTIVKSRKNY